MNYYEEFAEIYDILTDDFNYNLWGEYIQMITKRYNLKPVNILEMACGTGKLTEQLLKLGYVVDAFDLSSEMLAKANFKLSEYKNLRLFNLNMVNFDMNREYDMVISVCDSINYVLDEDDLFKSFKSVSDHLIQGGLFVFDINSEYKIRDVLGSNLFIEDRGDIFYTWDNKYDRENRIGEFYLTFFTTKDGRKYTRFDEIHKERAYSVMEIVSLLNKAGFKKIEYYSAFGFDEIDDNTERINFVAIK